MCLRQSLSNVLCLYILNSCDVFKLVTDALVKGIGSVLCITRCNFDVPVAFHSRQLRERERSYAASELEGLAVVEAVKQFEVHLFGRPFTVITDHRALTHWFCSTVLNAKLWRWALYLQQFDIRFQYLPGKFYTVADCLSRQAWPSPDQEEELSTVAMDDVILPKCPEPDADEFEQDSPSLPEAVYEKGRPQITTQKSTDLSGDVQLSQGGRCGRIHTSPFSSHMNIDFL